MNTCAAENIADTVSKITTTARRSPMDCVPTVAESATALDAPEMTWWFDSNPCTSSWAVTSTDCRKIASSKDTTEHPKNNPWIYETKRGKGIYRRPHARPLEYPIGWTKKCSISASNWKIYASCAIWLNVDRKTSKNWHPANAASSGGRSSRTVHNSTSKKWREAAAAAVKRKSNEKLTLNWVRNVSFELCSVEKVETHDQLNLKFIISS